MLQHAFTKTQGEKTSTCAKIIIFCTVIYNIKQFSFTHSEDIL